MERGGKYIQSRQKALAIAAAASAKKALDIVTIDMRKVPTIADYFVIASGTSTTHVNAISDNIIKALRDKRQRLGHSEGGSEALWILLDYGDVIAHVFYEEKRHFYNLERLWGDLPQEHFTESGVRAWQAHRKKKKPRTSLAKKGLKTSRRK